MVTPEEIKDELDRAKENFKDVVKTRTKTFVFLRRYDLFAGVIIGVLGNLLVSFYIEWLVYKGISENLLLVQELVFGVIIILFTIVYARYSGVLLKAALELDEFEEGFEDIIEKYEEILEEYEELLRASSQIS